MVYLVDLLFGLDHVSISMTFFFVLMMLFVHLLQERYVFKHPQPKRPKSLRIYEAHVGMSSTVCISPFSLECNNLLLTVQSANIFYDALAFKLYIFQSILEKSKGINRS